MNPDSQTSVTEDLIPLPTDRPRVLAMDTVRETKSIPLPHGLPLKLSEVVSSLDATFVMASCAAFFVLLHRYTGAHNLQVGLPAARHFLGHGGMMQHAQLALQKSMGFFIDTLALRIQFKPKATFRDLLTSVRDAFSGAKTAKSVNSDQTSESSVPVFEANPQQGFQFTFQYQPALSPPPREERSETDRGLDTSTVSPPELSLALVEQDGRWHATVQYASALFDEATIGRLLQHYVQLLNGLGANLTKPISSVEMLTEAERFQLLAGWNRTERSFPSDRFAHDLFELQASTVPDRVAVIGELETLTYRELNHRANRLATQLQARGVGTNVLVGLCTDRSCDLVVGLLAIMKAGGTYLPLDPSYPRDRIAFMLEDSATSILVTQRSLLEIVGKPEADCVFVEDFAEEPIALDLSRPPLLALSASEPLAYVLYTSGSTGKPKGVQISHRALVNFLHSMRREPGLTENDVLLAVTTLSFDIAGLELHLPLITGATIVLAAKEVAVSGAALLRSIEQHHVTVLQATPATWRLMLAAGWNGAPRLKALCGGEAMPANLAAALVPRCAELWNMYGPTETTIWSTCCRIQNATDVHVGRPIDNTEIYILNSDLQPVPVGHVGELMIGGIGLASGYLNRPELTAERFIQHPFKPGSRVFRTGDLARYRANGDIECLGRSDFQVKIRGFRIELGEIENLLSSHPLIKQSVVIAREDTPGDPRLIAYLIPRSDSFITSKQLRDHLRTRLPDYMLPQAYVFLRSYPLTPNGKIDRKALPSPPKEFSSEPVEQTVGPTEGRLKALFERILDCPVRSRNESFFDLGGHSILAAELMAAIEREFEQKLPLASLLAAPSVAQLAALLNRAQTQAVRWNSLVPIRPLKGKPTLFLIHGAGGNVLLYRELAASLGDETSVYGFQSQGLDGKTAPFLTIEEMAAHYLKELRAFQPHGPYHLAGYCMGGTIAFEMARMLLKQNQTVGLLALLDTYNFSLAQERNGFSFFRQKIGFHFANLATMSAKDLCGYIAEKLRMAREAGVGRISARLRAWAPTKSNRKNGSIKPATVPFLQKINDEAALQFQPEKFAGSLTVFRPKKQYDFMPDPRMGWGDIVSGSLAIVELPVNPHAMLIQPHVQQVGKEFKRLLAQDPA